MKNTTPNIDELFQAAREMPVSHSVDNVRDLINKAPIPAAGIGATALIQKSAWFVAKKWIIGAVIVGGAATTTWFVWPETTPEPQQELVAAIQPDEEPGTTQPIVDQPVVDEPVVEEETQPTTPEIIIEEPDNTPEVSEDPVSGQGDVLGQVEPFQPFTGNGSDRVSYSLGNSPLGITPGNLAQNYVPERVETTRVSYTLNDQMTKEDLNNFVEVMKQHKVEMKNLYSSPKEGGIRAIACRIDADMQVKKEVTNLIATDFVQVVFHLSFEGPDNLTCLIIEVDGMESKRLGCN